MTVAPVHHGLASVERAPTAVSIGFFDGVHRGHQSMIRQAVDVAHRRGLRSAVVTFDRHPMEVVRPGSQPPLLMTPERRTDTLARLDVDLVVVIPFDDELRHLTPAAFVDKILMAPLDAAAVVVGGNFRFGHRAEGDVAALTELGHARGFSARGVSLLEIDGVTVSSTEIRAAVSEGAVERASTFLGRPHVLDGIVVRGDQRGADLGFPTANLAVPERVAVPANGVYAGRFRLPDGSAHDCVTNVGLRPTFGGTGVQVEAHLLDADLDLYGMQAAVDFRHRLRGEQRFDGPDALVDQIGRDVAAARALLGA